MISIDDIFPIAALVFIFCYFLYIIYYTLDLFFLNPFKRIPPLTRQEEKLIKAHLPFYRNLSPPLKRKFKKRLVRFRDRKEINFIGAIPEQDNITLLLSATAVMLTLGMADFLILSLKRIIIYPKKYYSRITRKDHYGEYNAGLRTMVFSANHLLEGFRVPDDNLNLAVHEFAHAISFNVSNKLNPRSYIFLLGMRKIKRMVANPKIRSRIADSDYFRSYGKTNIHEFFAVSVENFIETPAQFEREFPKFYAVIKRMLNFGFYRVKG